MTTTAPVGTNPYVGPRSFRRGDSLYGRDRDVTDLLDLLIAERIVLLHSPSGAGKTSLIQARLVTLLEEEGFEVLPVVRLTHDVPAALEGFDAPVNRYVLSALMSLEEGLPPAQQHSLEDLARTSLARYVAEWPDLDGRPGNEVLIFDQFEEVITASAVDYQAKTAFFADLGASLRDRSIWAMFSMREDFLAELDPYSRYVPTRFATRFRLDLLTAEQALEAVTLPAQDAGVEFDEEAAVKLVDDLRRVRTQRGSQVVDDLGAHVEPVQLQVTCRQIWERRGGAERITVDDIESTGDVNEALAGYYAASVEAVSRETGVRERALRDWFEEELVTAQGFRGQVLRGPDAAGQADQSVLQLLTSAHLLRAESRRGATWYELAHDRLTQPIEEDNARWRALHLTDLERTAGQWDRQGRPDSLLLTGLDLERAQDSTARPGWSPTRTEREFLGESVRAQQQRDDLFRAAVRTRRWLRVAVGLLVLAVAAAGAATFGLVRASQQGARANRAAADAEVTAMVVNALGEASFDNQLSVLLGVRALRSAEPGDDPQSWQAANALQLALSSSPVFRSLSGSPSDVTAGSWSPDGDTVATADSDGRLRLVDAGTGELLAEHTGWDADQVNALDISPTDPRQVAVADTKGSVAVWDSGSDEVHVLRKGGRQQLQAYDVAFSPNGRLVASAGADKRVVVSLLTGQRVWRSKPIDVEVNAVAWNRHGTRLFTVDDDGWLRRWDLATGRVTVDEGRHSTFTSALAVSNGGSLVATGEWNGTTVISRTDGSNRVKNKYTDAGRIVAVSFASDDRHVFVLYEYGEIQVLDPATGVVARTVRSPGAIPTTLAASPRDPDRALVAGDSGQALWNMETGHGADWIISLNRDVAGRALTASLLGDTVIVWSPEGRVVRRHRIRGASFYDVAADPHGRYVAYVGLSGPARISPLDDSGRGRPLGPNVDADPYSVAVSDSGRLVAVGYGDGSIRVFDARNGRRRAVLRGHTGSVTALDFGVDEDLVSRSDDGTARTWDLEEAEDGDPRLATIRDEDDAITAVEWSPAGDLIAIGRTSGSVELHDPTTGRLLREPLIWHTRIVNAVDFSPRGDQLVSASDDTYAAIWDAGTGELRRAVRHPGSVYRAVFFSDGDRLVTTGPPGLPATDWLDPEKLSEVAHTRVTRDLTATECRKYVPKDQECPS